MNNFINSLLKSPSGKFGRKSFIILTTFIFVLLLGTFIVLSDKILEREVNRYAIDVFNSLLIFLGTLLGMSVAEKKIPSKSQDLKPEDNG